MSPLIVGSRWTDCASGVEKGRVLPRPQTTRVQGVRGAHVPVGAGSLVYAGKHRLRPQSTALITVIDFLTFHRRNHHHFNAMRIQP